MSAAGSQAQSQLVELDGSARQEKAAAWAEGQLVVATVKHVLLTVLG